MTAVSLSERFASLHGRKPTKNNNVSQNKNIPLKKNNANVHKKVRPLISEVFKGIYKSQRGGKIKATTNAIQGKQGANNKKFAKRRGKLSNSTRREKRDIKNATSVSASTLDADLEAYMQQPQVDPNVKLDDDVDMFGHSKSVTSNPV